jgi:hypothetical protein
VFCAILLVSINSRNIMVENGGNVVLTLLAVWTLFLPLGVRFSFDAVRASLRLRRENGAEGLNDRSDPPRPTEPVVSLAVTALLLQWVVIYALNVAHKIGPEWKDGTAVYYLFHQDRVITSFAAAIRDGIPLGLYKVFTYSALVIEALIALLLASPFLPARTRMVAWALAAGLHLSIASIVDLGPFSWAMVIMFIVLVPGNVWEKLAKRFDARYPRYELYFDRASGFWISFCRVVKRFDVLEHVRFVPVALSSERSAPLPDDDDDAGAEADEEDDEAEDDEDRDEKNENDADDEPKPGDAVPARVEASAEGELERLVRKNLVVASVAGGERLLGMAGLYALGRAIPFGWLFTLPLRLPGIHGAVARRLRRAARHAPDYDEWFELETLPKEPDRRAPEPTSARLGLRRGLATLRESTVALLMVVVGIQVLVENPGVPSWLAPGHPPLWMRAMIVYPRMFQGWSMFAPSPALFDSRLVVDGVTASGRHFDPLTGEPPVFEVAPPSARRMNQIWGEFHRRVGDKRFDVYMEGLKDFIRRHHDVVKRPEEKLVAFEAWVVTETIPAPGQKKRLPERRLLFSDGSMPPGPGHPALGPLRQP